MSGIINSAGSKSGVIGQTELNYEEGVFAVTGSDYYGNTDFGNYKKLGNQIWIYGHMKCGTIGANGIRSFPAPFSCDAEEYAGICKKGGSASCHAVISIGGSSATVDVNHTIATTNLDLLYFSMLYNV